MTNNVCSVYCKPDENIHLFIDHVRQSYEQFVKYELGMLRQVISDNNCVPKLTIFEVINIEPAIEYLPPINVDIKEYPTAVLLTAKVIQ